MKRTFFLFFTLIVFSIAGLAARGASDAADPATVQVYCYDSFASEWGPGPLIAAAFEEATGIDVVFHAPGDAVTVLNQLILEKDDPRADVVVGLDDSLLPKAVREGVLEPYDSPALSTVPPELDFDPGHRLLPYDYGHFAICWDSEAIADPPVSLEDLTDPRFAESLVVMDPRTSTPGLGFLLWTAAVYGNDWESYWERLLPSILTVTDSWSQAYALFTAGEAPLVLSYGTSPVYHVEYEGSDRYRAAEFTDGHVAQIEGMGVVAGARNRAGAEDFIDFVLGAESQEMLAMSNIMLPVNSEVELPESFDYAIVPARTVDLSDEDRSPENVEELIGRWTGVFSR